MVSGFGVVLGVLVTSGVTASDWDCGIGSSVVLCWAGLLLVLNAGPSSLVTYSICIVVGLSCGNSTSYETQSAVLFWAPDIHLKLML